MKIEWKLRNYLFAEELTMQNPAGLRNQQEIFRTNSSIRRILKSKPQKRRLFVRMKQHLTVPKSISRRIKASQWLQHLYSNKQTLVWCLCCYVSTASWTPFGEFHSFVALQSTQRWLFSGLLWSNWRNFQRKSAIFVGFQQNDFTHKAQSNSSSNDPICVNQTHIHAHTHSHHHRVIIVRMNSNSKTIEGCQCWGASARFEIIWRASVIKQHQNKGEERNKKKKRFSCNLRFWILELNASKVDEPASVLISIECLCGFDAPADCVFRSFRISKPSQNGQCLWKMLSIFDA